MLEIIGALQSTFVRTTRMALEEKGVPYKLTPARPHSPEVDAIHPLGKVPVMRHGEFTLFESRAIIGYADRTFDGPKLIPDDPKRAAGIEQWVSAIGSGIFPMVLPYLRENFFPANGAPDRALIEQQLPAVRQAIGILDRATASGHLAGGAFTLADMYALPIVAYLRTPPESGDAMAEAKALTAYFAKHSQRASFKSTVPPSFDELRRAAE